MSEGVSGARHEPAGLPRRRARGPGVLRRRLLGGTAASSAKQSLRVPSTVVGYLLEEGVSLAVENTVALLNGGSSDRLSEMAFAGAWRTEEESSSR
jgi:hypothetical protein